MSFPGFANKLAKSFVFENLDHWFSRIHEFSVLAFSRTKGHGFLKGSGGDSIFFHVSDVNGEVRFQ